MKNTEEKISRAYNNADRHDINAQALCLIAEQLRLANLLKVKELGIEDSDLDIMESLVDSDTLELIMKNTRKLRLNMGQHSKN